MRKIRLFLILSLLIFLFAVVVAANPYDSTYVDLFSSDGYFIKLGSGDYIRFDHPNGIGSGNTTNFMYFRHTSNGAEVKQIQFTFYSELPIRTMRFSPTYTDSPPIATLIRSYDNHYFYIVNLEESTVIDYMSFRFVTDGSGSFDWHLVSIFGLSEYSEGVSNINVNSYGTYMTSDSGDIRHLGSFNGSPLEFGLEYMYDQQVNDYLAFFTSQIEVPVAALSSYSIDKVIFTFETISSITVEAELNSDGIIYPVPVRAVPYLSQRRYRDVDINLNYYTVILDLTDLNVDNNSYITFIIGGKPAEFFNMNVAYYKLQSFIYILKVSEIPWYQTFWNWLRSPINRIIDLLSNMGEDSTGAIEENSQDLTDQATVMDELNEQLEVVVKPSVDPAELVESNISFTDTSLTVMTGLVDNDIITPILLVLCTLALLGYILFGSKGG